MKDTLENLKGTLISVLGKSLGFRGYQSKLVLRFRSTETVLEDVLSVGNILLRTQFIAERFVQLYNWKISSGVIVYLLIVCTTYEMEQIIRVNLKDSGLCFYAVSNVYVT